MNDSARPFYPYVDGLRALSIIAVVLFHMSAGILPGGFAGVDVFFVVSGFVVSASLHDYKIDRLRDLAAFFYARRFRRIVPALLLMLLTTAFVSALFMPHAHLSAFKYKAGVAAFFGYSNIVLARDVDYFSPLGEFNPFMHTWSLGVEEQFYLVFPVLIFMLRKRAAAWPLALLAGLCAASLLYGLLEPSLSINLGFFSSLARFWEIGSGVFFYALLAWLKRFDGSHRNEIPIATHAGLVLIGLSFALSSKSMFPVPGAVFPVAGVLLVMFGLHGRHPTSLAARLLAARPVLWLGAISYSLYLWHWPVFVMFRWTVGFSDFAHKLAALMIAVGCAVISYYCVEQPLRRNYWLKAPRRAIPIALVSLVIGYYTARPLLSNDTRFALSVVHANRDDWFPGLKPVVPDAAGCTVARTFQALRLGTATTVVRTGCNRDSATQKLFVIGDSHAYVYSSMLDQFAQRNGVDVIRYDIPGCSFLQIHPIRPNCLPVIQAAVEDIARKVRPGDVVFMPSLRLPRFRDQSDEDERDTAAFFEGAKAVRDLARSEAMAFLEKISRPGVRLVFELPKPIFKTPLFRCSDWFNRMNPSCRAGTEMDRAFLEDFRSPTVRFAMDLQEGLPGLALWDPFPLLCPHDKCPMWRDGKPLYFDADHISAYGNEFLYDGFAREMRRYGLGVEVVKTDAATP